MISVDDTERPGPTHTRIEELDVIRGAALLGVLVMNLVHGFRKPFAYARGVAPKESLSYTDRVVENVLYAIVEDKAMTLFSMLFGMGLAMFVLRAGCDGDAMRLLARRLAVLLLIGLLHAVFLWEGDILMPYAVAGFLSLLVIHRSDALLLVLGLALPAVFPLIAWKYPGLLPQGGPAAVAHYQKALSIYGHGTYGQVVAFRAPDIVTLRAHFLAVRGLAQILGNVLVGIFIWRAWFEQRHEWLFGVALGGLVIGGGYAIYRALLEFEPTSNAPATVLLRLGWNMTLVPLAMGYGAVLLILLSFNAPRACLLTLAPVGRMALTNYLVQSAIFSTIFYGYGRGLLGQRGVVDVVLMGLFVYAIQVIVSDVWLRCFQFGPAEWVWRSLTYGKRQPIAAVSFRRSGP
ncbi:DUF418 domain-containing protein [Pendulispora rubella]|uniref:DUF418 domain-containing protein n=1 Tax=Pendulispora rubella TaxID=2741070 RepID=A0ABZ2KU44_9BACT